MATNLIDLELIDLRKRKKNDKNWCDFSKERERLCVCYELFCEISYAE